MSSPVRVTYYLEVLSSWCHWAEPAWQELKQRFGADVDFQWRIALMRPEDFPASRTQCEWFYQRSGSIMRSPYRLHAGWFEAERQGHYEAPNLVVEAARDFLPPEDDRIRLAVTHAALRLGGPLGDLTRACAVAAPLCGIDPARLQEAAASAEIRARVEASTAAFHRHQLSQRPAFLIESAIGDKAVFSGIVRAAPLAAAIEALQADAAAYAAHAAHFGPPPRA